MDTTDNHLYSLQDVPPGVLDKLHGSDSAKVHLTISSAEKTTSRPSIVHDNIFTQNIPSNIGEQMNTIRIHEGATVKLTRNVESNERKLQNGFADTTDPQGNHSLLLVRVTDAANVSVSRQGNELSNDIFGTGGDPVNAVRDCRVSYPCKAILVLRLTARSFFVFYRDRNIVLALETKLTLYLQLDPILSME